MDIDEINRRLEAVLTAGALPENQTKYFGQAKVYSDATSPLVARRWRDNRVATSSIQKQAIRSIQAEAVHSRDVAAALVALQRAMALWDRWAEKSLSGAPEAEVWELFKQGYVACMESKRLRCRTCVPGINEMWALLEVV